MLSTSQCEGIFITRLDFNLLTTDLIDQNRARKPVNSVKTMEKNAA
jgi:hypothetical protein